MNAPAIDNRSIISHGSLVPIKTASVFRPAEGGQFSKAWVGKFANTDENCDISMLYKQVFTGVTYIRSTYDFFEDVQLVIDAEKEEYYQVDHWLVDEGCVTLMDDKTHHHCHRLVRCGNNMATAAFSIEKGTRFTNYKLAFTRDFLVENFDLTDPQLEGSKLESILNFGIAHHLHEAGEEELILLKNLVVVLEGEKSFLQNISAKSHIMQLLQKCCEKQLGIKVRTPEYFADVMIVMEQSISGEFPGIEKLATRANMSVSTFKRKFQTSFGTTPENYFRKLQMDSAELLLKKDGACLKEVAHRYGFANAQNFTTAFRKIKGYVPA